MGAGKQRIPIISLLCLRVIVRLKKKGKKRSFVARVYYYRERNREFSSSKQAWMMREREQWERAPIVLCGPDTEEAPRLKLTKESIVACHSKCLPPIKLSGRSGH